MGFVDVNSHVSWTGYEKTRPVSKSINKANASFFSRIIRTSYDFWALEVLIRVQIARREREINAHQQQQEVSAAPHADCREGVLWLAAGIVLAHDAAPSNPQVPFHQGVCW